MAGITIADIRRRAWHDTTHPFDVHERSKPLVRIVTTAASFGVLYLTAGKAVVLEGLGELGSVLASFVVLFLVWFLFNLWRAPARLASDALTGVEQRETTMKATLEEMQSRLQSLEARRPKVRLGAEGYNLVVVNDGGTADFRADLVVGKSSNWELPVGTPQALWLRTQKDSATPSITVREG